MNKKSYKCLFCNSHKCYNRIVSYDKSIKYDEVCCNKHIQELQINAKNIIDDFKALNISSTSELFRGESIERELYDFEMEAVKDD